MLPKIFVYGVPSSASMLSSAASCFAAIMEDASIPL